MREKVLPKCELECASANLGATHTIIPDEAVEHTYISKRLSRHQIKRPTQVMPFHIMREKLLAAESADLPMDCASWHCTTLPRSFIVHCNVESAKFREFVRPGFLKTILKHSLTYRLYVATQSEEILRWLFGSEHEFASIAVAGGQKVRGNH